MENQNVILKEVSPDEYPAQQTYFLFEKEMK